ncbi:hypothetical protein K457DRAFT_117467 [Linnemannia elongata AG-77]|uniref:Sm domain-containing protein n=1 Tax=Linnemannia elongata AG-77 TaxID=1314771 RepID=A0A197JHL5_9FUNG|nr:hypothetical protein K457DRAFT_117467 [Linnemannia elongata AG-77]
MEPKEDKPSVAQLRSLLNRTTRIKISDGRLFIGQFMCIDHSKNIILSAAYEYRTTAKTNNNNNNNTPDCIDSESDIGSSNTSGAGEDIPLKTLSINAQQDTVSTPGQSRKKEEEAKRFVGLVMIPGHHIVKAEMDCSHLRGADSRIKAPTKTYGLDYLRG